MFESFCSFSISAITFDAWFSAFSLKRADLSGCACYTVWVASVLTVGAGVFVVKLSILFSSIDLFYLYCFSLVAVGTLHLQYTTKIAKCKRK